MQRSDTPIRLWCFCYKYSADVLSLLATGRFELQGRTPYEAVMNYTLDISEYASFTWFHGATIMTKQPNARTYADGLVLLTTLDSPFAHTLSLKEVHS